MIEHTKIFWAIGHVGMDYIGTRRFYTRSQAEEELRTNPDSYPDGYEVVEVHLKWRTSS